MKSNSEMSGSKLVLELLGTIWMPAVTAVRVQADLNVQSLQETSAAVARAGYEVSYVDLPPTVSGFANVIGGKPHIVVNRAKSAEHQQYTLFHELGHQVLHTNPSPHPSAFPMGDLEEFQAHIFASVWVLRAARGKEREDVLRQNPESSAFLSLALVMTGGILAVALLVYLWLRLFPAQPSPALELEEEK